MSRFFLIFSFCYFAFVVFAKLGEHQLELFDEARRGVSTLEMYNGESHPLVPTYLGGPDHWGTKPPLLIWLQTAATFFFGPGEFAIRLPSPIATLLAISLMIWFARRHMGSQVIGLLAGWILLCHWHFVGNHGARSGDYDALLLLFSLAQVLFYFHWVRTSNYRFLYFSALA
ncbi:MAG: glycosyltransferase family 39 protein, partial [Bacteroidota bacterium]